MKGSNRFLDPEQIFEAASFSLRSLFVFRPLVREGEGAKKSSESENPSNPEEGSKDANPAWDEVSWSNALGSFIEPEEASFGEACSGTVSKGSGGPRGLPYSGTSAASYSCASTSWRNSKLFLFSSGGDYARGVGS